MAAMITRQSNCRKQISPGAMSVLPGQTAKQPGRQPAPVTVTSATGQVGKAGPYLQ
jgi:hypothetical protein